MGGQDATPSLRHGERAEKAHFHARRLPGVARHGELVLDNARYPRNAYVMAEAARLETTWLWLPTYSPHHNLIARRGKCVQADEPCREYWWCRHGRHYPQCGPCKQAIIDCFGRYQRSASSPAQHPVDT